MRAPDVSTRLKAGYLALAVLDTWLSGRPGPAAHRARFVTKPLLMPALAGSLATDRTAPGSPLRTSTLVAQAGGWGGDVALLGSGTRPFLVGVGSFGLGHVAYLSGFWRLRAAGRARDDAGVRGVAAAWAVTAPLMSVYAARQHRELGAPVLGYATLLAAMAAAATRLDPALPVSARRLSAAGAGLFMVSDTLLGLRKFGVVRPSPRLEPLVMATYTAAQLLLSEGAARA